MVELWLNFKDENGEPKRILVEQEKFTIGRTSENDLAVPLGNLSRQHAKIDRFADIFVISDSGSSNGTTLNGEKMTDPVALKNGDKVNLGGGLEIEIEVISDDENANNGGGSGGSSSNSDDADNDEAGNSSAASVTAGSGGSNSAIASGSGSSSSFIFILAPLLGVFILLIVGGIFLISRGSDSNVDITKTTKTPYYNDDEDLPKNKKTEKPTPDETVKPSNSETPISSPSNVNSGGNNSTAPTPVTTSTPYVADPGSTPKPANSSDTEKVKVSSASFLRRISTKDPNAFLTGKQTNIVNEKIKSFKGSSVLAENIKDAKRNSAKIQELARSKNLTPQFLVVAALTELGNQRGDVLAKANEMLSVLNDLKQVLGDEHADDSLLTIAALDQGKAGQFNQMRDLVSSLANTTTKDVRSIWFLNDEKKISPAEFDRALKFLAIGTITQNPKDFNVNAEAISF
jgi:FHA domain